MTKPVKDDSLDADLLKHSVITEVSRRLRQNLQEMNLSQQSTCDAPLRVRSAMPCACCQW